MRRRGARRGSVKRRRKNVALRLLMQFLRSRSRKRVARRCIRIKATQLSVVCVRPRMLRRAVRTRVTKRCSLNACSRHSESSTMDLARLRSLTQHHRRVTRRVVRSRMSTIRNPSRPQQRCTCQWASGQSSLRFNLAVRRRRTSKARRSNLHICTNHGKNLGKNQAKRRGEKHSDGSCSIDRGVDAYSRTAARTPCGTAPHGSRLRRDSLC